MEENKQFFFRSRVLLALFALCLLCFIGILYDAQAVNHDAYLSRSTTQVTTTETVESSRGILTDRNGKVLVSNRETYTITFDPDLVPKEEGVSHSVSVARAILRLVQLCQEEQVAWTDQLPVSLYPPFAYTGAVAGDTARSRFQKYLSVQGWSDSQLTAEEPVPQMSRSLQSKLDLAPGPLTARTLLSLMREAFAIDKGLEEDERMTDAEARLVLGVLYELELRKMDPNYYVAPYLFAEDVSVELISLLNDGGFAGVVVDSRSVRQYNTDVAAHVLGRTGVIQSREQLEALNAPYTAAKEAGQDLTGLHRYAADDIVGLEGAEHAFESYLRGKDGTRLITTNESGKITSELYSVEPKPGGTVALTLDIDFQARVEEALARAVEEMNAEDGSDSRGAAAAVVSVADSGVLALASYPTYSLKDYSSRYSEYAADPGKPFTNRAINGRYAPGSTFKMCTAVAALESGIITPATKLLTRGRYTFYPDYQPACWIYNQYGGTHGRINVSQAIYHSCNYFFYEAGRLTGIDTLNQYAAGFGLGQPTGIELSDSRGVLDGPEYRAEEGILWVGGDVLQCAIGQGNNLFTPIQLANYTATLVRGGARYNVHLLESVSTYDGSETLLTAQPELAGTVEMSESTLAAVKKGMGDLVSTGSISRYFEDCVVSAGAKTGSAQTGEKVANGVFVCFAPFDQPEIALAIVIEQGGSGAALASTAVEILNAYFAPSDIGTALVPEGTLLP